MKTALEVVASGMGERLKVHAAEKVRRLGVACKEREDGVGWILFQLGAGGGKAGPEPPPCLCGNVARALPLLAAPWQRSRLAALALRAGAASAAQR